MEIEFKISKDELIDFNMKYIVDTKTYKDQLRAYGILGFLIILMMILLFRSTLYTVTGIIMYIVFCIFKKKIWDRSLRRRVIRIYGAGKLTDAFETTHVKIIEKGITTNTKFSEKIHNWNSIRGLYQLEQYVLVTIITGENIVIPTSAFDPTENNKLFLETIIENTNLELEYDFPDYVKFLN